MSKWVQIRDSIEDALKVDAVSTNMTADFVTWLGAEGTDFAQKAVDSINEECKKDAATETGWCKIRDAAVIPVTLNIGMYVLKLVLEKAAAEKL